LNIAMAGFAATVFLSAFLLFQVQPLIGKYILPWFGGGPAVWTTCMLFFQVLLLVGYSYAHFVSTHLSRRGQVSIHLALLAASLILLPIAPNESWKPAGADAPTLSNLHLLLINVGGPFVMLAATSPLIQRWYGSLFAGSPYRLYALSNMGSLLALVSFPFVFEPNLTVDSTVGAWTALYMVFAFLSGTCALRYGGLLRRSQAAPAVEPSPSICTTHGFQYRAQARSGKDLPPWRSGLPSRNGNNRFRYSSSNWPVKWRR